MIDRNLLTGLISLITGGKIHKNSLKVVSSLMVWAELNSIIISPGLALVEYAHHHKQNSQASTERNIFAEVFKNYHIGDWLDLAFERKKEILPTTNYGNYDSKYYIEIDHFKMHYLEMLKIAQLFHDHSLSILEKFDIFLKWVYDNLPICQYTITFASMTFGGKSKVFKKTGRNFEKIIDKCINQAWDLTYLSLWSTLYYYENEAREITLFATNDDELKNVFIRNHEESWAINKAIFGEELGGNIIRLILQTFIEREKPEINSTILDEKIEIEKANLKKMFPG